jgi:hypothetical protein
MPKTEPGNGLPKKGGATEEIDAEEFTHHKPSIPTYRYLSPQGLT